MSVDPLAAGLANLGALVDAELAALAADAQALQGLLDVGTVAQARVLPSNGLTDLLDIAGLRVAASLPPTVRPGDVLTVRVTGFENDQIMVQVLANEPPAPVAEGPLAPSPAVFVAASIQTPVTASPPAPEPVSSPSVTPGTPPTPQPAAPVTTLTGNAAVVSVAPRAAALGAYAAFSRPADPMRPAIPPTPPAAVPHAVSAGPTSIEARLAAARAAATPSTTGATATPADPARRAAVRANPPQAYVVPTRVAANGSVPSSPAATVAVQPARATGLTAYTQPVALLRALRLPVTPTNVASATLALERPDRLPQALATLERALPQGGADPQVATLRALLGFVGRIEP
ncbi:MAG TPA: hypothetical protein VE591_07735, partial [Candidatus Acidoferrum sp.]|nr:hypothetical protein [Candidatus Acidoferrum sp.]